MRKPPVSLHVPLVMVVMTAVIPVVLVVVAARVGLWPPLSKQQSL